MREAALLVTFVGAVVAATYFWRDAVLRGRTLDRVAAEGERGRGADQAVPAAVAFPPRYRWLVLLAGVGIGGSLGLAGVPGPFALAASFIGAAVADLVERLVADRRSLQIEQQLADAIDLLVGALRAGASLLRALEATLHEVEAPLGTYLEDVVGRVRLGDAPHVAMDALAARVPLETFRLFSQTLAVHWEAGGSLASTLSTVGRTIRDRIELTRRVNAQSVEAKLSSMAVLVITYGIAFFAWSANRESVEAFAGSAIAVVLQAVGLVWMDRLSRIRF
jgi:tight adherence protein B